MVMSVTLATIPQLPTLAWLTLAALAYLLITCVLNTVATAIRDEQARHDLIVEARQRRLSYRHKGQRIGNSAGGAEKLRDRTSST